jgi:hypothetical protein
VPWPWAEPALNGVASAEAPEAPSLRPPRATGLTPTRLVKDFQQTDRFAPVGLERPALLNKVTVGRSRALKQQKTAQGSNRKLFAVHKDKKGRFRSSRKGRFFALSRRPVSGLSGRWHGGVSTCSDFRSPFRTRSRLGFLQSWCLGVFNPPGVSYTRVAVGVFSGAAACAFRAFRGRGRERGLKEGSRGRQEHVVSRQRKLFDCCSKTVVEWDFSGIRKRNRKTS